MKRLFEYHPEMTRTFYRCVALEDDNALSALYAVVHAKSGIIGGILGVDFVLDQTQPGRVFCEGHRITITDGVTHCAAILNREYAWDGDSVWLPVEG